MADAVAERGTVARRASGGLAVAAAIVAAGFLGSRLLGVLRTVAIANAFGSSPNLDAYNVAFRIPDLIFQVLAGATLGSAFIPVFARLMRREGEDSAWRLASTVLNLITVATAILCGIAFLLAPVIVPILAPGLAHEPGVHGDLEAKAVELTRIMLLSPLLFAMSGIVTGILNGRQRFFLSALSPMLYNLAIIAGAVFLAGPFGVEGLAIGVVVGSGLHLLIQVPGLFHERMKYSWNFNWRDPATREVARLMGPRIVGLAAAQVNFLITIYFGSKLAPGTISNLTYAWLLAGLPLALFGMAFSTAVFPRLADHAADDDFEALRETVSRVLRVIMFMTIPAALGLAFLRYPATILVLQRGEFGPHAAAVTAAALGFYCIGIVPQAGIEIHSRGFYAMGDTKTPVVIAVSAVLFNLVLSAIVWKRYEHEGLAFSVSAASWLEWSLLYTFFAMRTGASMLSDLWAIGRIAVCGAAMTLFLSIAFHWFKGGGRLDFAVVAIFGAISGVIVYAAVAHAMGIHELRDAVERVLGRIGRARTDDESELRTLD
ncbi:MAG TPA: murein biosynthesis integral membrane protein MurJ [Tepidiformaceae bacterium]|nr:murein biosynthesis integral membrane protein MurJ [Tepidiformaceae bacterium]